MAAIELESITKRYGDVVALRDVDLVVEEGEIYGFLGPNGAGKSTTINVLLDFARPTTGSARVLGHDAREDGKRIRQRIGVLPEGFSTYDRLTGRQHLEFAVSSKGADDDPDELAARVGIPDAIDRNAGGYSKGMAQRLVLGMALVGEPDLLILDEPSTGLDPNGAREMREIIREERDRGATVFFSSHILGQVEPVCDRVGILRDGELVAVDSIEGLRAATGTDSTLHIEVDTVPEDALESVRELPAVSSVTVSDTSITVSCSDDAKTTVLDAIERGASVRNFTTRDASLEDLFVAYTEDRSTDTDSTDASDAENNSDVDGEEARA
ncbi:MAG TPA: ABC transporter ATP-binding protein [Halococcus sp.]|nr:ABC transporter ATP-binding protein [Halococcus sp.]